MPEYIERESLINHVEDLPTWGTDADMLDRQDVIGSIENCPAADVAPVRHGRWEYYDTYMDGTTIFRCSYCGDKQNGRNGWSWKKNFCPNCGAIMDLK